MGICTLRFLLHGKQESVSFMHLNMDTEWMRSTCSIQVHRTLLLNNSICFSQLADSNTKEIKSKTKEWNDRIKQDKVS